MSEVSCANHRKAPSLSPCPQGDSYSEKNNTKISLCCSLCVRIRWWKLENALYNRGGGVTVYNGSDPDPLWTLYSTKLSLYKLGNVWNGQCKKDLSCKQLRFSLVQTETALMYDAVHLFATALDELDKSQVRSSSPGKEIWANAKNVKEYAELHGYLKADTNYLF